jgi:hypothetical protein
MIEDDDDLVLSSAAQAALAEFLAESEAKESQLPDEPVGEVSIDSFPEDWQVFPSSVEMLNVAFAILVRR